MRCSLLISCAALFALPILQSAYGNSSTNTGLIIVARYNHTATLLADGKVLVAGGTGVGFSTLSSAEVYDPATGTWASTGSLNTPRYGHTALLLPNGKVLVAGGGNASTNALVSAELYDPATGTWTPTGSLNVPRQYHSTTLLTNGKVVLAGGYNSLAGFGILYSEVYDPASGTWSFSGLMPTAHWNHTATLLPNGKVLVAGGQIGIAPYATTNAVLYDPSTGQWTATSPMHSARAYHSATLLPNGTVLAAAGFGGGVATGNIYAASSEIYDPAAGTWTTSSSLLKTARAGHAASLLANGEVFVAGGYTETNGMFGPTTVYLSSAEVYDPTSGTWSTNSAGVLATNRAFHTATMLAGGEVLIVGGQGGAFNSAIPGAEIYDATLNPPTGAWTKTGSPATNHFSHTATFLLNSKVLVAGGGGPYAANAATELYDPTAGSWTNTHAMNAARSYHTASLLADGRVLVAGGLNSTTGSLASAELYYPGPGTWITTGPLNRRRAYHTATLLANGKVLVAGGYDATGPFGVTVSELYDPANFGWSFSGLLSSERWNHTATLLANGKVLIAGGQTFSGATNKAELYDPATGAWTITGHLNVARYYHSATLLPSGKVLVAGGYDGTSVLSPSVAELYDPATGVWTKTGTLNYGFGRESHVAALLLTGKVLVAGGADNFNNASFAAELYDPATGLWTQTGSLQTNRTQATATPLADGRLLISGGLDNGFNGVGTSELYDLGLGFNNSWRPQIATMSSAINLGGTVAISGSGFRGLSEASGACNGQSSPSDHPLLQLHNLQSGQTTFVPTVNWSSNSFSTAPVSGLLPGLTLATVFVNGIPSASTLVSVGPLPIVLGAAGRLANGAFQFSFTNVGGLGFTALAATNAALTLNSWTDLGPVTETTPGQYQFTDYATNNQRFYRVRWP